MKAYTRINYIDLSLEEVEKIGIRITHIDGRNNGMLFNGRMVLSVPMDSNEFTIKEYMNQHTDIIDCGDDLEKFISYVSFRKI